MALGRVRTQIGKWLYKDFSGGLNDTFSDLNVGVNEGFKYRNVNLDRDGAVTKRRGAQKLTATKIVSGKAVMALYGHKPLAGTAEILAVCGTKLVKYDGASGWTDLYTTLTDSKLAIMRGFKNLLYLQNGTDNPLVYWQGYAGSPKVWRAGTPRPATAATKNSDIAGSMTAGNIYVRVRYVSAIDDVFVGEADVDAGTLMAVTASGGIRINIPVYAGSDHNVAKRVIERTTVGGGIFYIDGYVNDNVATTYDITQSDAALLADDIGPDPGARNVMPILFPWTLYGQRVIGYDPSDFGKVVWSEIDEFGILPEAFPAENYIYLDITDGRDVPIACAILGDFAIFYCGRSVHMVHVDESGQGYKRRLSTHELGILGANAVQELPSGHLLATFKGPYLFNGGEPLHIGERVETLFKDGVEMSASSAAYWIHRYDRKQVKLVLPGAGAVQNNLASIYHYRRASLNPVGFPVGHAWTTHDGFTASCGAVIRDDSTKQDQEYSGDYDGTVWKEDIGTSDDHSPSGNIAAEFQTAWFDANDPFEVKYFTDCWVIVQGEAAGSMTVAWETDFGDGPGGAEVIDLAEGAALWDSAVWNTALWSGGSNKVVYFRLAGDGVSAMGRFIRFLFSNASSADQFAILGFVVAWQPERDRQNAPA